MTRRFFREQAERVQQGGTPVGVTFDEPYLIVTLAGNAVLEAQTRTVIRGFDGCRHLGSRPLQRPAREREERVPV
jgi:hypothetical protein